MIGKLFALGALAIAALGACQADDDLCVVAVSQSDACGMPLTKSQCKALNGKDAQALSDALAHASCGKTDATQPTAEMCKLAGWPCPAAIGPEPVEHAPKYPIVYVGGIDSSAIFDWNPALLARVSDLSGAEVFHAPLPSWASTEDRAAALWSMLLAHGAGTPGTKFNLVCYAVGGLDCRTLASPVGLFASDPQTFARVKGAIASITTISTPHRGTRVADAAVLVLESGTTSDLIEAVTGVKLAGTIVSGALIDSLRSIALDEAGRRSATLTDGEGIYYQSFAGVSHVGGDPGVPSRDEVSASCVLASGELAYLGGLDTIDHMQPSLVLTAPLGGASAEPDGTVIVSPTDGMVSVESAKWGTFRGCIPSDHYQVIGQLRRNGRDVFTGFDPGRFHAWVANDLAAMGY